MSRVVSCAKCGEHRISGPTHVQGNVQSEGLRYACLQCGHTWSEPTADKKSNPAPPLDIFARRKR